MKYWSIFHVSFWMLFFVACVWFEMFKIIDLYRWYWCESLAFLFRCTLSFCYGHICWNQASLASHWQWFISVGLWVWVGRRFITVITYPTSNVLLVSLLYELILFSSDVAYFDGVTEIIITVGLVKPKPGVFQDFVHYLLILITPSNIVVLGVTFSQSSESTYLTSNAVSIWGFH